MSTEVEAKNAAISCAITVARYLGFDDAAEYLETETGAISSISEETARRAVEGTFNVIGTFDRRKANL